MDGGGMSEQRTGWVLDDVIKMLEELCEECNELGWETFYAKYLLALVEADDSVNAEAAEADAVGQQAPETNPFSCALPKRPTTARMTEPLGLDEPPRS